MVLLGLSCSKVGRDSKFDICQDSLFSVDTTLPSAEAGDDPFVVEAAAAGARAATGGNDESDDSCSSAVSAARLNSILASVPSLSEDYWQTKSLHAALKVEGVDGDKNTVFDIASKEEMVQNMVDPRRRFVEYMNDVQNAAGEDNRRVSINIMVLPYKLKTLVRSNSFRPNEKALLVGRGFWSSHIATNVFHSIKNNVSDSAAKRFFLYSVSHLPMIYLTSFILIKRLKWPSFRRSSRRSCTK